MFHRWMIFLGFVVAVEVGIWYWLSKQADKTYRVYEECMDYLRSLPSDWTKSGDSYFSSRCDLDNPFSAAVTENNIRDNLHGRMDGTVDWIYYTLLVVILSFVARWIITGRVR